MDERRFDGIAQRLATRANRRTAVNAVAGGGLGLLLTVLGRQEASAACRKVGQQCKTRRGQKQKCCGGAKCQGTKCKCPRGRAQCAKTCCAKGKRCVQGTCVAAGGTCDGDVCPSGCPYTKVQDAIDAAADGATIRVCSGTYAGVLSIVRNLTLTGAGLSATTLEGNEANTLITIAAGCTVTITDMTLTGGKGPAWGGGVRNNGGDLTLDRVAVTGNSAGQYGGGIYQSTFNGIGSLNLNNSRVTSNTATDAGGGIYLAGVATVTGSSVEMNTASGGGGISLQGALTLSNSNVTGNTAASGGGVTNNGTLTLANASLISDNKAEFTTAGGFGGGIYNTTAGHLTSQGGSEVRDNAADAEGGGIYNNGGTATVAADSVTGNSPDQCAGTAVAGC